MKATLLKVTLLLATSSALGCAVPTADSEEATHTGTTSSALGEAGQIRSLGQCLDVQWDWSTDGTPVWMYTCSTSPAQVWHLTPANEIRLDQYDKCLTGAGTTSFTVWIETCNGSDRQKWFLHQDGSIRWQTPDENLCLDVAFGGATPQTRVGVTYCNSSLPGWQPQTFTFSTWRTSMSRGDRLLEGQELRSPSGQWHMVMQSDCNLVIYNGDFTNAATWDSGSWNRGSHCQAVFQDDGNFVVIDGNGNNVFSADTFYRTKGTILGKDWSSVGNYGNLQDDGNFVIFGTYVNFDCFNHRSTGVIWSAAAGDVRDLPVKECGFTG
jgi:hypothetical protein